MALFQVGDVVYARPQSAGCSYSYEFGEITKITKTGRYRVQPISTEYGERKEEPILDGPSKGTLAFVYECVVPGCVDYDQKTFLISAEGVRKGRHCQWAQFRKYEENMELSNYYDLGD